MLGAAGLSKFIYLRGAVSKDEREEEKEEKQGGKSMTVLAETALTDIQDNVIQIIFSDLYFEVDWSATLELSHFSMFNIREINFCQTALRNCHILTISCMKLDGLDNVIIML